jgi:hypothetical protein
MGMGMLGENYVNFCKVSFSSETAASALERRERQSHWRREDKTRDSVSEIGSKGITLTCRQYKHDWTRDSWTVDCETTSPLQPHNLDAHYYGPSDGLPDFYRIIQNVRPAD